MTDPTTADPTLGAIQRFLASFDLSAAAHAREKLDPGEESAISAFARGEMDGVPSEYDWLAANRPGWRATGQSLIANGSRMYDLLHIENGSQKADVYFDITEYFGKM